MHVRELRVHMRVRACGLRRGLGWRLGRCRLGRGPLARVANLHDKAGHDEEHEDGVAAAALDAARLAWLAATVGLLADCSTYMVSRLWAAPVGAAHAFVRHARRLADAALEVATRPFNAGPCSIPCRLIWTSASQAVTKCLTAASPYRLPAVRRLHAAISKRCHAAAATVAAAARAPRRAFNGAAKHQAGNCITWCVL